MNRHHATLLALTWMVLTFAGDTVHAEDWDLRRDYLPERFPDQWRYQGAQPSTNDIVDLVSVPPEIHLQDGTPLKSAWIEPGAISGSEYGRAFMIVAQPPGQTIPADSVFIHPETELDPVVSWTAPFDGTLSVKGRTALMSCNGGSDGVAWSILVAGKSVWSAVLPSPTVSSFNFTAIVHQGETVLFRENTHGTSACDWGYLSVRIVYLSSDEPFRRGDANEDGVLNIADPGRILQYLFGGESAACLDAADTDDDGMVNISDAIGLLGYLFLGTLPPTAPFNACGLDPALDELSCKSFVPCH